MSANLAPPTASNAAASLLAELDRESKTTRRVLARVPAEKLEWKPHPKSMSLGQLAVHVAGIPGQMTKMVRGEGYDIPGPGGPPAQPESGTDFVGKLDVGLADARELLSGWTDADAEATWRLTAGGGQKEVFAIPRAQMIRTMLLNHWYHHRGQLSLYLRMLDVPVPAVYGRSADESFLD